MKFWIRWVMMGCVAGLLGLAGTANAAGVTIITNANTGKAGTAAVRADGVLFEWGALNSRSTTPSWYAQNISSISSGGSYVVQTDGSVVSMDYGNTLVAGLSPVQEVIELPSIWLGMTQRPSFAIQQNGKVRAIMTVTGLSGVQTFVQGFHLGLSGVSAVSVVPRESGLPNESWAWGVGSDGMLYDGRSTFDPLLPGLFDPLGLSNVAAVVPGLSNVIGVASDLANDTFVVKSDGTVWAWGPLVSSNGAFNSPWGGPFTGTLSPVQVPGLANISSIAVGSSWNSASVYAVTATGEVWAWGMDSYGQLGDNRNSNNGVAQFPVKVQGLTNVAKIYTIDVSAFALTVDGSVWGWGDNYWGQLGDGTNITRYVPVQVGGLSPLTGVTSLSLSDGLVSPNTLSSSYPYSVAVRADGSVWAWGDNSVGQLGDGTRVSRNAPVQVLGEGGQEFFTVEPAILTVLVNGVPPNSNPSYVFANQAVGTTSAAQTMTFTNVGLVSWTGFSFLPSVGDFAQTNNCGSSLAPGASCTINITFTPTRAGLRTVTTDMNNMGASNLSGPGGMTLTGTGVGAQAVMSSSLGFGTQKTTTTTTKTVTLSNAGSTSLTVGTPGITGAGFSLGATTCAATLAAGASCTMNVDFAPTLVQAYSGTLTFTGSSNPGGAPSMALSGTGAATAATRGDFDGNGKADILWRNQTNGQNAIWFMNGTTLSSAAYAPSATSDWIAVAISDFNGDGKGDILWSNPTAGLIALWTMNAQSIATASFISSVGSGWSVVGTGDFDGNGKVGDILWFNTQTRQLAVWLTSSAGQITSAGLIGSIGQGWSIAGVGDFNGDGKSDILWRNTSTGANAVWLMNGTAIGTAAAIQTVLTTWTITGVGDLNGDGKADILWRDAGGSYAVWFMNGAAISSAGYLPAAPPVAWTSVKLVDFNGDGKADIMWRDNTGATAVWLMNGSVISGSAMVGTVPTTFAVIDK